MTKARPVYLNLVGIRLPLPGVVSNLHRISGALLFLLGIPASLYLLQRSTQSAEANAALQEALAHPLAKLVLLGLAWAYLHHFCAGIRYLFLDVHVGGELKAARQTSVVVLIVSLALTAVVGAHYGWRDWLLQRLTAVLMAVYTLGVLGIALYKGGIDHALFASLLSN